MKLTRLAGLLAVALTVGSVAAYAAGNYSTYPIVGGASFCVSTVGVNGQAGITGQGGGAAGTNGAYCAQTVPAGPPIVTGNELIPADTGLAGGAPPQTVTLTLASLNALPPAYPTFSNATAANTFTVSPLVGKVIIFGANSLALSSTTMQMPANPIDGQELALSANQTIATFVVSPNAGQTIDPKALVTAITSTTTASYGYQFIWNASKATWFRLQ